MSFLLRIFKKTPAAPPLPPMRDPVLGNLTWDEDSEGWVGLAAGSDMAARLYIGAGTAHEYPSEDVLSLLREPSRRFPELVDVAQAYLASNMNLSQWNASSDGFRVEGLETYAHFLPDGVYTITLANGDDEAIWKVHFKGLQPVGCGVDD